MSGISKLVARDRVGAAQPSDAPGFHYAFRISFVGEDHDRVWQPPVWPSDKLAHVQRLFGLVSTMFTELDGETVAIGCFPASADDLSALDATLRADNEYKPKEPLPPSLGGRLLAPSELSEWRISPTPGSLHRGFRIANYSLGTARGEGGSTLRAATGWNDAAIRYVAETFGGPVFFKRIRDSQVMVIQIDHDEEELEVLRQMLKD